MNLLSEALAISVVAYVYAVILTEPGEILHWWKKLLRSILMAATEFREQHPKQQPATTFVPAELQEEQPVVVEADHTATNLIPTDAVLEDYEWLYNPLVGCAKCVAGQFALFWYLITSVVFGYHPYRLDYHIATISLSILFTIIIKHVHEWMKQKM